MLFKDALKLKRMSFHGLQLMKLKIIKFEKIIQYIGEKQISYKDLAAKCEIDADEMLKIIKTKLISVEAAKKLAAFFEEGPNDWIVSSAAKPVPAGLTIKSLNSMRTTTRSDRICVLFAKDKNELNLRDKLTLARLRLGWNQDATAEKINKTVSKIRSVENGFVEPKVPIVWYLSKIYGEAFDYLIGISDKRVFADFIPPIEELPSEAEIMFNLGINLKLARKKIGLFEQEAGELIGKNATFITKLEQGQKELSVKDLLILAEKYGIKDVESLLLVPDQHDMFASIWVPTLER